MQVASGVCPLTSHSDASLLSASSGGVTVHAQGSAVAIVRWDLPAFALHMVVGSAAASTQVSTSGAAAETLQPLRELVAGKRKRDDPLIGELLDSKRRKPTEKALAQELRRRTWRPSVGLVDAVVHHQC